MKQFEKQKKLQEKLRSELLSLRRQNQQSEIDLMKEGSAKKIAQINLDYDNEIAAILTKEKEWKDAQGGKLTKEQTVEIRTALVNSYVKRERSTSNVNKEQLEEEKRAMNEYLKEYGSYLEKRQAITELYNEKIAKATTKGERKSLSEAMKRELSDLDIEASKTTSAISRLFGDMKDKTLSELEAINRKGREALEFLKSGVWDESKGKDFGITKETFELWSKSPDKLKDISDALKENKEAADKLRPAYEKVAKGLKGVFEAGSDTKKLRQAIDDIEEGLGEIMRSGQFLSDTFSKLGDSFGGAFGEIAEGLNVAMDAVNSAMDGAKAARCSGRSVRPPVPLSGWSHPLPLLSPRSMTRRTRVVSSVCRIRSTRWTSRTTSWAGPSRKPIPRMPPSLSTSRISYWNSKSAYPKPDQGGGGQEENRQ